MINLALEQREAQALQQLIGETVQKGQDGIWNLSEDTVPTFRLSLLLQEEYNIYWTDESSTLFWWSEATPNYKITYGENYNEFEQMTVSPVFVEDVEGTEDRCEAAEHWVEHLRPDVHLYLYRHRGRGIEGPGFWWNANAYRVQTLD